MALGQPLLAHGMGETVSHAKITMALYYLGVRQIANQVVWFDTSHK